MQTKAHPRSVDEAIAALASRQGGVVARRQLLPVPRHRGVFFVGHGAKTPRTMMWAAHLAIGPTSVISHRSAAALWELRPSRSAYVELTVPGPSRRRRAIRVHRTTWLPDDDVTSLDGLRITTIPRTLLDLGAVLPFRAVERAFDQADRAHALDFLGIQRVLHEGAARPGAATLRAVVGRDAAGTSVTDTELEELMLALIRRAGLPEPVCQYGVLEYRADFCWPEARLIAEADGPAHDTPAGRIHDARRDVALQNAGWRVLRFPEREILGDPAYVAEAIRTALTPAAAGTAPSRPR